MKTRQSLPVALAMAALLAGSAAYAQVAAAVSPIAPVPQMATPAVIDPPLPDATRLGAHRAHIRHSPPRVVQAQVTHRVMHKVGAPTRAARTATARAALATAARRAAPAAPLVRGQMSRRPAPLPQAALGAPLAQQKAAPASFYLPPPPPGRIYLYAPTLGAPLPPRR